MNPKEFGSKPSDDINLVREAWNSDIARAEKSLEHTYQEQIMSHTFGAFKEFIRIDEIARAKLRHPLAPKDSNQTVDQYVLIHSPEEVPFMVSGKKRECFVIRLENDEYLGQNNREILQVFMPVPEDFDPHTSDVEDLEKPERIWIKRTFSDGNTLFFAITSRGAYKFDPDTLNTDKPVIELAEFTQRVSKTNAYLAKINQDLGNMRIVPQRKLSTHSAES